MSFGTYDQFATEIDYDNYDELDLENNVKAYEMQQQSITPSPSYDIQQHVKPRPAEKKQDNIVSFSFDIKDQVVFYILIFMMVLVVVLVFKVFYMSYDIESLKMKLMTAPAVPST
jgi:ATP-dependent Zn protease